MTTLQYQCSMSLDGFIAGPGGDMSWLASAPDPTETDDSTDTANPLVEAVGAILSGNRTHRGDDPNAGTEQEGAYGGQYTGPTVVLTHHIPDEAEPGVVYAGDLDSAVAMAKEAAANKLVAVLGADVARQCIESGALDEILVYIAPVLLGDGVRLFSQPGGSLVKLDVLEASALYVRARVVY